MLSVTKLYRLLNNYIDKLIIPEPQCVLCTSVSQEAICRDCYQALVRLPLQSRCPRCLWTLPPKEISCSNCKEHQFQFDRIIASYSYAFPLDKVLQQLKYHEKIEYTTALSQLFWSAIAPHLTKLPDAIIPVPLHHKKHKIRGFNQVHELLREFHQLNPQVPILNITRHKETQPQATLNRLQRAHNLANAFEIKADLRGKHIALVDDVVTTATTVNELAKLCKQRGATQVDVWCLMRALE